MLLKCVQKAIAPELRKDLIVSGSASQKWGHSQKSDCEAGYGKETSHLENIGVSGVRDDNAKESHCVTGDLLVEDKFDTFELGLRSR